MLIYPQCAKCIYFKGKDVKGRRCCDAFPKGIPEEIFLNKVKHDTPYPGDNGIVFEQITYAKEEPEMDEEAFMEEMFEEEPELAKLLGAEIS